MPYVLISVSEDGDIFIASYTKKELQEMLNNEEFGRSLRFLSEIPENSNPMYWTGKIIIKGDVITPVSKEVVTEWTVL